MNPLQCLMDEHRLIEKVIDALTAYAKAVHGGADHPREDLADAVAFIQGYADAHHHGKEEDILFRAMAEQGMPTDMGPLGVMLQEHEEGRGYTRALAEIAKAAGPWDEEQRKKLSWAATSYGSLLRQHIQKEDQVLYPMADQMLPEAVWRHLESAFEAFESDPENTKRAQDLRGKAERLVARYGGSRNTEPGS